MKIEPTTIRLPRWMLQAIDDLVQRGVIPYRSEFIREAIREHLLKYYDVLETRNRVILRVKSPN